MAFVEDTRVVHYLHMSRDVAGAAIAGTVCKPSEQCPLGTRLTDPPPHIPTATCQACVKAVHGADGDREKWMHEALQVVVTSRQRLRQLTQELYFAEQTASESLHLEAVWGLLRDADFHLASLIPGAEPLKRKP